MRRAAFAILVTVIPAAAQTGFPFTDESLNYTITWPSGLSLGEGRLTAARSKPSKGLPDRWEFQLALDAAAPGYAVADRYRAVASTDFCSCELEKNTSHGSRKSTERTTFDSSRGVAARTTKGGGTSETPVAQCARDALTFVYYARGELSQGRVPPGETVLFGSSYQVRLEYTGPQSVMVSGTKAEADRVTARVKGPASDTSLEIYYARDPARTPLVVRVPLSLGTLSMELVR